MKRREYKDLIEKLERFKTLADSTYEAIFLLEKGYCIEVNDAGCNIFGYSHDELIGMYATTVVAEEYQNLVRENLINNYEEPYEIMGLRKDGTKFHAEIQGKEIKFQGKDIRMTAVRDITARNEAELKILESESKFKAIFEGAGDGILIGNMRGEIVEANDCFCEFSGYNKEELIGKHIKIFFSEESLKESPLRFDLLDEGKSVMSEREIIPKSGKATPIEMNTRKVHEDYYISIFRVLSERRKAEERLKESNLQLKIAKEKAEESDNLKSVFLANLSHEVRTPMNGIVGFAEMLNEPGLKDDKREYYTNIIINSSYQLKRIIDDILEISILETKQVSVILDEINLNTLILNVFSVYDDRAKSNKTPLYIHKGLSNRDCIIMTDEVKLLKVLNNLLENAINYTQEGNIELGYDLVDNEIQFYVKDTGIGINKNKQEIIFDRFSQEDKGLSSSFSGLGLGLSIAKQNTELLGGKIWVESIKGKGSTFFFTIPYKLSETVQEKAQVEKDEDIGSAKVDILIAEDEEVNYLYIETMLHKLDFEVNPLHAKNGKEAVEIFKNNPNIPLVLMDIKMPGIDGLKAAKLIRKINPKTKIVIQTAYSFLEDERLELIKQYEGHLTKPIEKEVFFNLMHNLLKE